MMRLFRQKTLESNEAWRLGNSMILVQTGKTRVVILEVEKRDG